MSLRFCQERDSLYSCEKLKAQIRRHQHYGRKPSIEDLYREVHHVGPHTPSASEDENIEEQNRKPKKATAKRRSRRNKLKSLIKAGQLPTTENNNINEPSSSKIIESPKNKLEVVVPTTGHDQDNIVKKKENKNNMADQSKADVLAARQAKKLAKANKVKAKNATEGKENPADIKNDEQKQEIAAKPSEIKDQKPKDAPKENLRSKDEVDKAIIKEPTTIDNEKSKEQIKADRAAKKAAKQAKKKGAGEGEATKSEKPVTKQEENDASKPVNEDMTVKDVVEALRDIANVAKEIQDVTEKVSAINFSGKAPQPAQGDKDKPEESGKSKAELKAERRAKQEAQRAAKQAALEQKAVAKPKPEVKATPDKETISTEEKKPKQKSVEKTNPKSQSAHKVNWFPHLYKEHDKESLKSIALNSHLHPAIVKLGVQLASRVVIGSNARCIALLDALKKMVRDYTLPAKTEFSRGLESHLATSLEFLWKMRAPSASQTNAVKFFRYHLTQLPNNVDEFDAKKTLQAEIDKYIREQIDMAGEAISIAVRNKISNEDNILTYGYSSLIERILREAWEAGVHFRTVVVGNRVHGAALQMLRRLAARGLPCTYADITSLSCVMHTVSKVVVGAGALLADGSVLGALGTAQVALAARARNVPVLVACETHKFSERVQTDAVLYSEIGDPDDLIDKSDSNSPLKDWRSNPNLTPLNLTYDVTPASLVTAVVTELAILPCTSAPVVLRFKLSEYSV